MYIHWQFSVMYSCIFGQEYLNALEKTKKIIQTCRHTNTSTHHYGKQIVEYTFQMQHPRWWWFCQHQHSICNCPSCSIWVQIWVLCAVPRCSPSDLVISGGGRYVMEDGWDGGGWWWWMLVAIDGDGWWKTSCKCFLSFRFQLNHLSHKNKILDIAVMWCNAVVMKRFYS